MQRAQLLEMLSMVGLVREPPPPPGTPQAPRWGECYQASPTQQLTVYLAVAGEALTLARVERVEVGPDNVLFYSPRHEPQHKGYEAFAAPIGAVVALRALGGVK